jgi:hypothetical protein
MAALQGLLPFAAIIPLHPIKPEFAVDDKRENRLAARAALPAIAPCRINELTIQRINYFVTLFSP